MNTSIVEDVINILTIHIPHTTPHLDIGGESGCSMHPNVYHISRFMFLSHVEALLELAFEGAPVV